jgi:hypothetical protein
MNDTSPEMQALHRRLLMERSGEERFRMGVSMCRTARAMVWASLPTDLPEAERRARFFLRVYGNDFDPAAREHMAAWIRSGPAGTQSVLRTQF